MSQCKTRQDCLRELARVMDMVEGTDVPLTICVKFAGNCVHDPIEEISAGLYKPEDMIAAVAIVEGKPVFIGDTFYSTVNGHAYTAGDNGWWMRDGVDTNRLRDTDNLSWNPPPLKKEPPIPEGFTRHDGGECPVHPETLVKVVYMDSGGTLLSVQNYARNIRWGAIFAYKVIKPATVMVELTREDAESIRHGWSDGGGIGDRFVEACRKAFAKEQS